jgi:hypothetical protein
MVRRTRRDAIANHLATLGFQLQGVRRLGTLTHLFVPAMGQKNAYPNASMHLGRLQKGLKRMFRGARAFPRGAPLTLRTVKRRPTEPLEDFWMREEAGVRQHVALRQTLRPAPPVPCLTDAFLTEPFVPFLYMAGYSPDLDAYVTLMEYAPGTTPSAKTPARGLAAVERALFTLWLRGVALPGLSKSGVRVSGTEVRVVDFTSARPPLKNVGAAARSQNPLFPGLWDAPPWLRGMLSGINAARRSAWLWSPECQKNNNSQRYSIRNG